MAYNPFDIKQWITGETMNKITATILVGLSDVANTAWVFSARVIGIPFMTAGAMLQGAWIGLSSAWTRDISPIIEVTRTQAKAETPKVMAVTNEEEVTMTANTETE